MEIVKDLFNQNIENKDIAKLAIENTNILNELVNAVLPENKDTDLRYKCHHVLLEIGRENPKLLYSFWDDFVELLKSKNAFHNMNGVYLIAYSIKADIHSFGIKKRDY